MKRAVAIALLALPAFSFVAGRETHCTFRLHAEANARDGAVFSIPIRSQFSGKPVAIEKMAAISERDVIAFQVYQAADGTYGALFQLDEHGRLMLDALSVEHRGAFLFLFVNGRPLTELQIDRRVSDGKIYVPSGLTLNDIALMKKDWRLVGPKK
ncbi:MAG TPA: hypothetical protein VGI42_08220 [Chthoniobacterales bacterium]|jgi:hypothetical protein